MSERPSVTAAAAAASGYSSEGQGCEFSQGVDGPWPPTHRPRSSVPGS